MGSFTEGSGETVGRETGTKIEDQEVGSTYWTEVYVSLIAVFDHSFFIRRSFTLCVLYIYRCVSLRWTPRYYTLGQITVFSMKPTFIKWISPFLF